MRGIGLSRRGILNSIARIVDVIGATFIDTFVRANAGNIGSDWSTGPTAGSITVNANEALITNTSNVTQSTCQTPATTDDNYVQVVVGTAGWVGVGGPFCRGDSTTSSTHYLMRFASSTSLTLTRSITGTRTTLATVTVPALVAGSVLRMEVETISSSQVDIRCYINGTLVGSTYSDTNAARIMSGKYSGVRQTSNSQNMRWGRFESGDV